VLDDFTAPHTPRFGSFQGGRQALVPDRAARAQRLGALEVGWGLGEPEIWIADMTRQGLSGGLSRDCHVLSTYFLVWVSVLRQ
jgi:hypothetical protein